MEIEVLIKSRSRNLVGILLIFVMILTLNTPASWSSNVLPGQSCKKIGDRDTYGSRLYVCIKKANKLVWNKGETIKKVNIKLYVSGLSQGQPLSYEVIATKGDKCVASSFSLSKKIQSQNLDFRKTSEVASAFRNTSEKISRVEVDCEFSEGTVEFVPITAIFVPTPAPSPKPSAVSTPSPAPTLTPRPTSTPDNLGGLPIGERTYFGQDPTYKARCWFAKKYSNPSNVMSLAAEQIVEVISPQGTRMFTIGFDVPSLLPGTSIWVSNWSIFPYGCEGGIGSVRDRDITKRIFYDSYYVRSLTTSVNDRPVVLGWTTIKRIDREVYGLIVKNNSKTFDICSSNETLMSLVFFNSANEPIFAVAERIREAVPPDIQATVFSWDEIGLAVKALPNLARIEPSLIFEMCSGDKRSY